MKNFKPMLAVDCGDVSTLRFPLLASPKLDGVRCIVTEGGLMSRSLKPIPNVQVQKELEGLPVGLDGELIAGDPFDDPYRRTVSMVMADDKPIDGLRFQVFDRISNMPFSARFDQVQRIKQHITNYRVQVVPHRYVHNLADLLALETEWVGAGYEGVMLRDPEGPYKCGRSTRKEGYLLKLKRFCDSEAEVIGVVELMHNGNEAKTNALGRTERSTAKAGKTGMGVLGALQVRDVKTGVEFEIGTGFTALDRQTIWNQYQNRAADYGPYSFAAKWYSPIGKLAKYKYFPTGSKDKPRFPVFLGWRDKRDV